MTPAKLLQGAGTPRIVRRETGSTAGRAGGKASRQAAGHDRRLVAAATNGRQAAGIRQANRADNRAARQAAGFKAVQHGRR